jgi:tRNA pseudouridine-54 N-methylase
VRPGVSLAEGGLELVTPELSGCALVMLDEGAPDVRGAELDAAELAVFVGDHLGFSAELCAWLEARGARAVSVGPTSLFAEDAIVVLGNELDRRATRAR